MKTICACYFDVPPESPEGEKGAAPARWPGPGPPGAAPV